MATHWAIPLFSRTPLQMTINGVHEVGGGGGGGGGFANMRLSRAIYVPGWGGGGGGGGGLVI